MGWSLDEDPSLYDKKWTVNLNPSVVTVAVVMAVVTVVVTGTINVTARMDGHEGMWLPDRCMRHWPEATSRQ